MRILPTEFDGQSIRRVYDEDTETWWFSAIDVVHVLTASENVRDYWFKMKLRVTVEDGAALSTFCRQLKSPAADGKQRLTDVATAESLLRIVQSIPSPKAESHAASMQILLCSTVVSPARNRRNLSQEMLT